MRFGAPAFAANGDLVDQSCFKQPDGLDGLVKVTALWRQNWQPYARVVAVRPVTASAKARKLPESRTHNVAYDNMYEDEKIGQLTHASSLAAASQLQYAG